MKQKFIVYTVSTYFPQKKSELYNNPNVILLKAHKTIPNKFIGFIRHLHLSYKINNVISLPFKQIWHTAFKGLKWNKETEYFVVFSIGALYPLNPKFLNNLKKKYNVHYILHLVDHWESPINIRAPFYISKVHFDYILTFDPKDAQKYSFIYYPDTYSVILDDNVYEIENDLFFCGSNKGRVDKLHSIYEYLKSNDIRMKYVIVGVKENERKFNGIIYDKSMKYEMIVENVRKSNCILDMVIDGQTGQSWRYYEAVCYNKKLLTNNKNIVNMPFYDPRYMKVFEKPEDIDVEWVKKREEIDYHYDGRYSPIHLIDKILELEREERNIEKR